LTAAAVVSNFVQHRTPIQSASVAGTSFPRRHLFLTSEILAAPERITKSRDPQAVCCAAFVFRTQATDERPVAR
tara:strand:- start:193793 stop:194014 length:222 start_codon:yes stop_codon:yes gene_type:complete